MSSSTSTTEDPETDDALIHLTNMLPLKVLAVQIGCAYAMWIFGKFACKVNIQEVAFALPVTLIMPSTLSGIVGKRAKSFKRILPFSMLTLNWVF